MPSPEPSRPAVPQPAPDWTVQAADTIESVVARIRDKSVRPLTFVARGLVYGSVAATLGMAALVLFAILLVRVLSADVYGGRAWAAHLTVGALFTLVGLGAWTKRRPSSR